jgi:hypothetical protein
MIPEFVHNYVPIKLHTGYFRGFVALLLVIEKGHWCDYFCPVCEERHAGERSAWVAEYERRHAHRKSLGMPQCYLGMSVLDDFHAEQDAFPGPERHFLRVARNLLRSQYEPGPLLLKDESPLERRKFTLATRARN